MRRLIKAFSWGFAIIFLIVMLLKWIVTGVYVSKLWDQDIPKLIQRLHACLALNELYQENCTSPGGVDPPGRAPPGRPPPRLARPCLGRNRHRREAEVDSLTR